MKKLLVGMTFLSILSTGNLASASDTSQEAFDKTAISIQSNISASIQGTERQIIANAMQGLSLEDQKNVIYITEDGTIYANKPELKDTVEKFKKINANLFEDSQGNRYALPAQTEKPNFVGSTPPTTTMSTYGLTDEPFILNNDSINIFTAPYPPLDGKTGPYRRVFSKPNYAWSSAYVYLPGGSNIKDSNGPNTIGDAGFVYLGGWGNTGSAVDAGFIHGSTNSDWAPMIQINGTPYGQSERLSEAQNAYLKFLVNANNKIAMAYSAIKKSTGTQISQTFVMDAPGFSLSGGNIMKRMTTIGQKTQNMYSGSYIKNVHWYNTLIGLSDSSYHAWSSSDQATDDYSGYHTYPDSTKVTVNFVNAGEETDTIILQ